MDHIVCVGVLNFFSDLSPVFGESARILRKGGLFVFVVGDRSEDEALEVVLGPEITKSDAPVTLYRHSAQQISRWAIGAGFTLLRSLAFTMYMDREKTQSLLVRAYLLRKGAGLEQSLGGDA